jgi:predicted metal-dependent hydrolase
MWRWHAIEEIEHKAVAYDTWLHATRDMPGWKRWTLRSFAMLAAAVRFHYVVYRNTAELLAQDRKNNPRSWWRLLRYLYGDPGLMRLLATKMFGYFRPGFHPWQHDDRALAQRALATLSPPLVAPMPK